MGTQQKGPGQGVADDQERFLSMVRKFDTAMLVTCSHEHHYRARPMAIADVGASGDLWFVSRIDTPKADEIREDHQVLVALQGDKTYLSVSGMAKLQKDPARIRALWKEAWRVWFKDKDDPNLVLIQVTPEEAEYWDQSGVQGIKYLFRAAKAYVTGNPLSGKEGDTEQHGKVRM